MSVLFKNNITISDLSSNLVAFYNFNGDINDSSGNGKDLTVGPSCDYNFTTPLVGSNAIQFNNFGFCGTSSGLTYRNNIWNLYDGNTSASYSLWFKYTQNINFPGSCAWTFFGADFGYFGFNINPTYKVNNEIVFGLAGVGFIGKSIAINVGEWYHIVGTYDHTTGKYKIYKNGHLIINEQPSMSAPDQNYQGFAINGSGYGSLGEYGIPIIIDAVGLWDKALNYNEVLFLYNSNNGNEYPLINFYDNKSKIIVNNINSTNNFKILSR